MPTNYGSDSLQQKETFITFQQNPILDLFLFLSPRYNKSKTKSFQSKNLQEPTSNHKNPFYNQAQTSQKSHSQKKIKKTHH